MTELAAFPASPSAASSLLGSPGRYSTDGNSVASGIPNENVLTKVQSAPAKTSVPPKTDKPRPHVCATCSRSFARLEHLKRHERSHTKEKPFECPQCTRCFARRDLLLRHQQKLHLTAPPTGKGKRRESVTSVASGRVRKSSTATEPGPRPRANTISHVDASTIGMLGVNPLGIRADKDYYRRDVTYTAPPVQGQFFNALGSTVNPAQLHMSDLEHDYGIMDTAVMEEDENYDWIRGFNPHAMNDQAMASPSVFSHGSLPGEIPFSPQDMSNGQLRNMMWPNGLQRHASMPNYGDGTYMHFSPETFYPSPSVHPMSPQHLRPHPLSESIQSSNSSGSAHNSSVTSVSTDSITDVTRHALLMTLSQPGVFGHGARKFSQPTISSPLRDTSKPPSAVLPSTADLQRYVSAYIQYFHPHFPFLHIPTLSFDSPAYTNNIRMGSPGGNLGFGLVGGGGCLILAMASIGALYEFERPASKELFEASKKMIQLYLEERRKADLKSPMADQQSNTPLWLVQAMLLNVIYGHNCGDKISGDIASTHCSALVSLARAAGLLTPWEDYPEMGYNNPFGLASPRMDDASQWHMWIIGEERKRTLYAIFHMSSMLVSAYNHAPALMNSEIMLDLPCEEELWSAESAATWMSKGGVIGAQDKATPFATALSMLLNASQSPDQHKLHSQQPFAMKNLPSSSLRPSTFGCLTLINALHNYIWETRQRHSGRQWTTQETESMHAHIEPALRAWQAAWASNPTHSLERPNPFGVGPLSADCIPLLDLAYVRLFVNLGMSKEFFWQRDFDAMADELARGSEFIQHADYSDESFPEMYGAFGNEQAHSTKRERHLRKAACYAADSLSMSDKLGVTFAHFTSRELPLQAGLCTFDCAQILAEWVSTVQERVGPYVGVLGRDNIDFGGVPAVMLLEEEDRKLLEKTAEILAKAELKIANDTHMDNGAMTALQRLQSVHSQGYGSKILHLSAYLLERAAVWPVTTIMAEGLASQAVHMQNRAENSTQHA